MVAVPDPLPERLPLADRANVVKRDKTLRYLLNPNHPLGLNKARRFRERLGYERRDAETLRADLARAVVIGEVAGCRLAKSGGLNWVVHVVLTGPNGKSAPVVTVWHALAPGAAPRFVTAWVDD